MVEIEYSEKDKVDNLYNEIRNIILSKKDNQSFNYDYKQHRLHEESKWPGISRNYYNESGSVEFENINGQIIILKIDRWHAHQHNGCSGLDGTPCLKASIFKKNGDDKQLLWELNVESRTLYYKAEVTSLNIPKDILQEKQLIIEQETIIEEKEEVQEIKQLETRILFDEINNLYARFKLTEQQKHELLSKRKKEMEEATEKIIQSYSEQITKNNADITSTKKELYALEKLFIKYSSFNARLIGNALQQLISLVEGEEYLYKEITQTSKKRVHSVIDSWDEDIQTKSRVIVSKDKLMNSCQNERKIKEFFDNGEAILLSQQEINNRSNKITFYTSQNGQVMCHVDYGKFDYIREFIENIVQYRFQNSMEEFTQKNMLLFLQNFILEHKDIIMKNYDSKIKEIILMLS